MRTIVIECTNSSPFESRIWDKATNQVLGNVEKILFEPFESDYLWTGTLIFADGTKEKVQFCTAYF